MPSVTAGASRPFIRLANARFAVENPRLPRFPGLRWTRLFLLGLASIYPLYWMAQFLLFFLPASRHALFHRLPLAVVDISYLQAAAAAGKSDSLPAGIESLLF